MANTLLKNVVAATPATGTLTMNQGAFSGSTLPAAITLTTNDGKGNPIDASAGTVTTSDEELALSVGDGATIMNALAGSFTNLIPGPGIDVSVPGQVTLTWTPAVAAKYAPGSYQVSAMAVDSAGGTKQLLAVVQLVVKNVA